MLGGGERGEERKDKSLSMYLFIKLWNRKKQAIRPEATRSMGSDTFSMVPAGKVIIIHFDSSKQKSFFLINKSDIKSLNYRPTGK